MSAEHYLHHDADTRVLIAEAEVRGAVRALREAAVAMGGIGSHRDPCRLPDTDCLCGVCDDRAAAAHELRDRADRIEATR